MSTILLEPIFIDNIMPTILGRTGRGPLRQQQPYQLPVMTSAQLVVSSSCAEKRKSSRKNLPALNQNLQVTSASECFPVYPGGHEEEDEGDKREERREGETSKRKSE